MKLFYSPAACSLASHIVLCELGLPHTLERVDLKNHKTASGEDFNKINPKGYVPALLLDDGQLISECPAVLQYLAEQKPEADFLPPAGTLERIRVVEWLTFIGTELHKNFTPLFRPDASADWKAAAKANIEKRLAYVDQALTGRSFLMGNQPCIADAYLFTAVSWCRYVSIDLSAWPELVAFQQRMAARPAVQEALFAEGLLNT